MGLLLNFGSRVPEFNRLHFNPAKRADSSEKGAIRKDISPSSDWLYPDLVYEIMGGLFEVHTLLGAGFVHRIYTRACRHELSLRDIAVKPAKRMQVSYKGTVIGSIAFGHLLVEGKIIVFPVAIGSLQDIRLENLKQWMRLCDIRIAILANFDAVHLEFVFVRA